MFMHCSQWIHFSNKPAYHKPYIPVACVRLALFLINEELENLITVTNEPGVLPTAQTNTSDIHFASDSWSEPTPSVLMSLVSVILVGG